MSGNRSSLLRKRALRRLSHAAYRARYAGFRAQGMTPQKAYDRAIAAIREGNADLFARLLAEEYQLRLAVPDAATPAGDRGSVGGCERAAAVAVAAATQSIASAFGTVPDADHRTPLPVCSKAAGTTSRPETTATVPLMLLIGRDKAAAIALTEHHEQHR